MTQNIEKNYIQIKEYKILTEKNSFLGKGSYGKVLLAQNKNNDLFAAKIIDKSLIFQQNITENLKNEVKLQKTLSHPNICKLFDFYEDKQYIYLILEYIQKGSLKNKLNKLKTFSVKQSFDYFYQIAQAIAYLHEKQIIHRDIKPENILLNEKDQIKICDFGYCTLKDKNRNEFCGTIEYIAPEIINKQKYDEKIDIWSLGVLLYEMIFGKTPFQGENIYKKMNSIIYEKLIFDIGIDESLVDLLNQMLCKQQENRISIQNVLKHEWVQKNLSQNQQENIPKQKQFIHTRAKSDQEAYRQKKKLLKKDDFAEKIFKDQLLCHKFVDIKMLRIQKTVECQQGLMNKIFTALGCVNRDKID